MNKLLFIPVLLLTTCIVIGQEHNNRFSFALVTDTHIGSSTSYDDLRKTVADINANDTISFVIFSGDVTEFGSDREFLEARSIIDSLGKPWYIIPGNHDTKWSESGGNSFRKVFGAETFAFTHDDFMFIGTNSGPNMRMSPGQVPRENIVWLDSVLMTPEAGNKRIIFINHYPLDNGLNNWYEITDRLKQKNIQLLLCGHGHANKSMDIEGIPCMMGRSNLRAGSPVGGYNIMHVTGDSLLTANVKKVNEVTAVRWNTVVLRDHKFMLAPDTFPRPDFSINEKYSHVKEVWRFEDKSDIGSGIALSGNLMITTNTDGFITAFDVRNGRKRWQYGTGAKIYSTPAVAGSFVIGAATDGVVYALDIKRGKKLWSFDTGGPVVASPVVDNGKVFMAGSSGKFFCLDLRKGFTVWVNDKIEGFVETRPLIYNGSLFFGTWANHFYALDILSGRTRWDWHEKNSNRNLSPAACVPVAASGRIFVVTPARQMVCLNPSTGEVNWRSALNGNTVRESMGVSEDKKLVYAKTMDGKIIGVPSLPDEGRVEWIAEANTGYDISPSVIVEEDGIVFVPTDKGFVYAVSRNDGKLLWAHRISSCLINHVVPVGGRSLLCSTMDGVITRLDY